MEPNAGEIFIDETNLNKLSLKWLKNQIAYVPQKPEILNSSIMNNILLANDRLNEQEISRLLQTVGLDETLKTTNLTIVDLVDSNTSKGTLKDTFCKSIGTKSTNIYLDDPLSNLDNNGILMVIKLIESLKRANKTIIMFSDDQRLSKVTSKVININS